MKEQEIFDYLKKTSLIDFLSLISRNNIFESNNNDIDIYYTAKDLFNLYPKIFSKYKLDKYIKEENLPVIRDGKDRIFLKSDVDEWLRRKNMSVFNNMVK